jgi:hypothetical protein
MCKTSRFRASVLLVVTGALLLGSMAGAAQAKSYVFRRVIVDATVLPDGSLQIVEDRTYDFDGAFHGADFTIDWPPSEIEDFKVTENGKDLGAVSSRFGNEFRGTWFYEAADQERTFTISYRADCAVDVFSDTAHLLWQFVGTGWTVPTDYVKVTGHLAGVAEGKLPPRPKSCSGKPTAFSDPGAYAHQLQGQIDAAIAKAYEQAGLKPPPSVSNPAKSTSGGTPGSQDAGEVRAWATVRSTGT